MNTGFIINEKSELQEVNVNNLPQQPALLQSIAKIVSYIFHPVFVPVYIVLFMVYLHPFLFAGLSDWNKTRIVITSVMMFTFFPVITVLLLKALDFIKSIHLTTQRDRVIPLIACMIWYFWIWWVWHNQPGFPAASVQLTLAIFISSILALFGNIVMKISLHTISMGVMLAFMFSLAFTEPLNYGVYLGVALLVAGFVCTSRFIVSDHTPKEIYGGLVLGILSMLVALVFA